MHPHRLNLPHLNLHQISGALNSLTLTAGLAVRFVLLSAIACFLVSRPIFFREVAHVSHRPSPRA
jgi:hypothetical protein